MRKNKLFLLYVTLFLALMFLVNLLVFAAHMPAYRLLSSIKYIGTVSPNGVRIDAENSSLTSLEPGQCVEIADTGANPTRVSIYNSTSGIAKLRLPSNTAVTSETDKCEWAANNLPSSDTSGLLSFVLQRQWIYLLVNVLTVILFTLLGSGFFSFFIFTGWIQLPQTSKTSL